MPTSSVFSDQLLQWFDLHGRKHLPWQQNKTGYRVWISEIMLQQTQVATVISYFERFMQRFPDIASLANASEDDVMHLWAGLGYYSRARNLHRAAKMVMSEFGGEFPNTIEQLQLLPGIGPSTSGAIAAIAFNQHATILDGNVKRVLARYHAVTQPINDKVTENILWKHAQNNTPKNRVADYTQAIMDLGATLCTRSKPRCGDCPFTLDCEGYRQGIAETLPAKKASKKIPVKQAVFLVIQKGDEVLLQKRAPVGIWGGLWSLPEMAGEHSQEDVIQFCQDTHSCTVVDYMKLPTFRHTFSHYHLDISPVKLQIKMTPRRKIMDDANQIWYKPAKPATVGLPKPIQLILKGLK